MRNRATTVLTGSVCVCAVVTALFGCGDGGGDGDGGTPMAGRAPIAGTGTGGSGSAGRAAGGGAGSGVAGSLAVAGTSAGGSTGVAGAASAGSAGVSTAGESSGGAAGSGATAGSAGNTSGGTGGVASEGKAGAAGATSGGSAGSASGGKAGSTSGGKAGAAGAPSGGTGGSGSSGACAQDPKTILAQFKQSGDKGESFDDYVNEEVGPLTCATEGKGGNRTITNTIFVPPGVTYDGKGEVLTAQGMGDGSQDEGQRPFFLLAPGANLSNVTFTAPGVEGVHMMGNNTLTNIVWQDVGEDAASVRSYFPGGAITITGGSARSAADKVFQFNAPCSVTIRNFEATDIAKLVRQNGGTSFALSITLENVTANDVGDAVVMSDSDACTVRYRNLMSDAESLFEGCAATEF